MGFDAMSLEQLRADFERKANRSMSMPAAGCIVWTVAAVASLFVPPAVANLVLIACVSLTFPVALLVARVRGENMSDNRNPLTRLMLQATLMVNLLWALLIPLSFAAPALLPLGVGIGFGLHWVVFSWIVGHPVGLIHALLRTTLVSAAWFAFPDNPVGAVALAVVLAYLLSLWQLHGRGIAASARAPAASSG